MVGRGFKEGDGWIGGWEYLIAAMLKSQLDSFEAVPSP